MGRESLQYHVRGHHLPSMHLKNVTGMKEHTAKAQTVPIQDTVSCITNKTPVVIALAGGICAVKMKGQ